MTPDHDEIEGLIPLHAAGALSSEEAERVETHIGECAPCAAEARELAETAAALALSAGSVQPPPGVRERVMREVHDRRGGPGEVRPMRFLIPLAAALALVVVGWGAMRYMSIRAEMKQLAADNRRVIDELRRQEASRQKLEATVRNLTAPDVRSIELAGTDVSSVGGARIFLNARERSAIVFFQNLPSTPQGHDYQLWVLRSDRPEPQSAGVFDVDSSGEARLELRNLPVDTEIKAFAITLEPDGGLPAPSGTPILSGGL